jgi:hypothetical protein
MSLINKVADDAGETIKLSAPQCLNGCYVIFLSTHIVFDKQKSQVLQNKLMATSQAKCIEITGMVLMAYFKIDAEVAAEVLTRLFQWGGYLVCRREDEYTLRFRLEFKRLRDALKFKDWLEGPNYEIKPKNEK